MSCGILLIGRDFDENQAQINRLELKEDVKHEEKGKRKRHIVSYVWFV